MKKKVIKKKTKFTVEKAIKEYQCSGCMSGGLDSGCFENNHTGVGCGKHRAGTIMGGGIGKIFLGMPKGFNRLYVCETMKPRIHEEFIGDEYDMWNIPVWKHLDEHGNTLVRGLMPRRNEPFIDIFLGNQLDKIDCLEITAEQVEKMD